MSKAEGVFKPAAMSRGVLTISSRLKTKYTDEPLSDSLTYYEYSPKPERNRWMQVSVVAGDDLIYLLQVKTKPNPEYAVFCPVRIVEDDPVHRRFLVDLAPVARPLYDPVLLEARGPLRLYDSVQVKVRLFQAHFRRQVLGAYRDRCCVCSLPERPLLDGAHITPDRDADGEPVVNNGLSMCALHHRAFDAGILAVSPNYQVVILEDRLAHPADPANHVLLDHQGKPIRLPADPELHPSRERLEARMAELGR